MEDSDTHRAALLARAADIDWFHALDFGDCQSPGRFAPGSPQNRTLFGVMDMLNQVDLKGLHCVDIGTADGLIAFNMATRGAERVVATDIPEEGRPSFNTARALLGLDVEMVGGTTIDNVTDKLGEHRFDVVVCAGVMYHMLNPFDCILKARRLLKRDGLLLLQTRYHPEDEAATLDLNMVSGRLDQLGVFWVPSKSAVTGMLALGGFQLLALRTGTAHDFIATISRNVPVEEVEYPTGLIVAQHKRRIGYPEFRHELPEERSRAEYRGAWGEVVIDDLSFRPNFPPHPSVPKPLLGAAQDGGLPAAPRSPKAGADEELAKLKADLRRARRRVDELESHLGAVYGATSWRITAPLRALGRSAFVDRLRRRRDR